MKVITVDSKGEDTTMHKLDIPEDEEDFLTNLSQDKKYKSSSSLRTLTVLLPFVLYAGKRMFFRLPFDNSQENRICPDDHRVLHHFSEYALIR